MSKRNRERKERNRQRLRDLGIAGSNLGRAGKRQLMREMSSVPTLANFREQLVVYSAESIIAALAAQQALEPFIVSRLVHEAALSPGNAEISVAQVMALGRRLMQVADPELVARAGTDLSDAAMARMLPQQLIGQSALMADVHRVLSVLAPDIEGGPVGRTAWRGLLGMELTDLIVAVMGMTGLIGPDGTIDNRGLAQLQPGLRDILSRSVDLLSADLEGVRQVARYEQGRLGADVIRGLGPLVQFPLVRLEDDRLAVPSRAHLVTTVSTAGLYIRLVRADAAARTRERTDAIGTRFEGFLQGIAAETLPDGWIVTDLDEGAEAGQSRADFLVIPPDSRFVLVVEAKTTLQSLNGQLRAWDDRSLVDLYQRAFDQIEASAHPFVGSDTSVFGLVVTLDRHITTRVDGRTYVGVPIGDPATTTPSASSQTPSRLISSQDFEDLIEALASGVSDHGAFIKALYEDGSSMNMTERVRGGLPTEAAEGSLADRFRVEALRRLASSVDDDAVRAALSAAALG